MFPSNLLTHGQWNHELPHGDRQAHSSCCLVREIPQRGSSVLTERRPIGLHWNACPAAVIWSEIVNLQQKELV